ncbi:MAG: hypothetical protein U5N86_01395 [Planctomycetota bacterium]|nr:hypothetical protein [Planctomycetota bacterium]
MEEKLKEYFDLVEKSKTVTESPNQGIVRNKLREVKSKIRKTSTELSDPSADMDTVMAKIKDLKEEQNKLMEQLQESGGMDKTTVKKRIVDIRKEILESPHREDWDELVRFFSENPVALTAMIDQVKYDQKDPVKILRTLPFRGRVSGPYGTRYDYEVTLQDGTSHNFSSVRKIILALDQYNRDFRSLALTYDALQRYISRGISMNGIPIKKVTRTTKES